MNGVDSKMGNKGITFLFIYQLNSNEVYFQILTELSKQNNCSISCIDLRHKTSTCSLLSFDFISLHKSAEILLLLLLLLL